MSREKKEYKFRNTGERKHRALLLLLLIVLTVNIAACGRGTSSGSTAADSESGVPAQEDVVIRVGDKQVTVEEVMFYVLCVREQYEGYFGSEIWSVDFGNDRTFEDMCKEDILNEIVQLKIITAMAEAEGVLVTEDEADEIADTVREQMEEISEMDALMYHIDTDLLENIYHDNYLSSKMFDVVTSEVDTAVSDEEARRAEFQVLTLITEGEDKNRNQISMTEEEKTAAREKAEELRALAVGDGLALGVGDGLALGVGDGLAADAGNGLAADVDFESMATVHSDLEEVSVTIGRGEWKEEFDQKVFDKAAFALKTGELSPVIEGEHGFYLIYCVNEMDEDATAQAKEDIISERQDEAFRKLYAEWEKEFRVTVDEEKWAEITFQRENNG